MIIFLKTCGIITVGLYVNPNSMIFILMGVKFWMVLELQTTGLGGRTHNSEMPMAFYVEIGDVFKGKWMNLECTRKVYLKLR